MVVIISSKVRTVAHCNYTCAAIAVWKGMWVERCGKYPVKLCVLLMRVCVCGMCSEREKKNWRRCDWNWCTVSNKTTKQQKSNSGVMRRCFSCLQLSPRFSSTTVLKGIVQKRQHVRHDKANNLLSIILFPLSPCPLALSPLVIFFLSVCSRQCDLQDQPGKRHYTNTSHW